MDIKQQSSNNNIIRPRISQYTRGTLDIITESYHAETISEHHANIRLIRCLLCVGVGITVIGVGFVLFSKIQVGILTTLTGLLSDIIFGTLFTFYNSNEKSKLTYFQSMSEEQERIRNSDRIDKLLNMTETLSEENKMRIMLSVLENGESSKN